jgi:hypothetical protein
MLFSLMVFKLEQPNTPLFWTERYSKLYGNGHRILNLEVSPSSSVSFAYSHIEQLRSPGRATFGGLWPNGIFNTFDSDFLFLLYRRLFSKFEGLNRVTIVFPPRIFLQNIFEPQIESLKKIAPCRIVSDTNYHVEVENWTTKSLSKGNRKKIRQFNEMGGVVSFSNLSNIKQCYDILVENRRHRGVQLTMEFEDFKKSLILCEKDFKLIQANIGGNVIATSLLVKIMPDYWYVLYWGESIEFRNLSPVASIFYFLIEQAKSNKVVILDLGISSVNGTLDEGLARFKTNLGAVTSEKLILELDLYTD